MLCLDSVTQAIKNLNAEIIVIDNNSNDQSLDLTHQYFPDVKTIANKENSGFSKANNLAVKHAKGTYICILNPDTVVSENCFKKLLRFYKENKKIGAIGTQLIDGNGHFLPESKRHIPTPSVAFQKLIGEDKNYYQHSLGKNENGKTEILVGAFMFLKREDYTSVGGFDEDFFMYGEDIDLSYKLIKNKLDNYYLGELKTIHFKGESTLKDKKYYDRFFGAMLIFYKKHYSNKLLENTLKIALKLIKYISSKKNIEKASKTYTDAVIITENKSDFNQLKDRFKNLSFVNNKNSQSLDENFLKEKYIIFDANSLTYAEVIEKIVNWRKIPAKFRIKPKNMNFCIGSDSKEQQGEKLSL